MITSDIIDELEKQAQGVIFGKINLEITIHDGNAKFRIIKEVSLVPGKITSGSTGHIMPNNNNN